MRPKNVLTFPVQKPRRKTIVDKFVAYFSTPPGRDTAQYMIGTAGLAVLGITFLPQSIFFDEYRKYFIDRTRTAATPTEVNDELIERMQAAAEKLKLIKIHKKVLKSLTVPGFDIQEFGSVRSSYGARLGIPVNYFYKNVDDIDKNGILVNDKPINWDESSGRLLQESLVLTESEQIFAFCRSLLELKSFRLYLNPVISSGSIIAAYTLGQYVNIKYNMFKRPYYIRYAAYPVVGMIGYGLFGILTDFYTFQREKRADKELAKLGPEMIDAGISFYTKLINKETALRELNGEENANQKQWLGFRRTPIAKRKEFFEQKKKELLQQQEKIAA